MIEEEEEKSSSQIDLLNFNYNKQDLNKLDDHELSAHKAIMEESFQ